MLERRFLAAARLLARAQRDGAAIGDQQRVEDVNRVRAEAGLVEDVDLDPELVEQLHERRMLASREIEIDRVHEAVRRVIEGAAERLARCAQHDLAQWRGHRLGAI